MGVIKHKLIHELTNNTIHIGTQQECKLILKGLTAYGEREDKFTIAYFTTPDILDSNTKQKLINILLDNEINNLSYLDVQQDIAESGTTYPGIYNFSDEELIEEYNYLADTEDELFQEIQAQLAIYNTLNS